MYRIGDKVRIKETSSSIGGFFNGDPNDTSTWMHFQPSMNLYWGKVAVIIRKSESGTPRSEYHKDCDMWHIDLDRGAWTWVDEWFELVKANVDTKKDRFDTIVEEEI